MDEIRRTTVENFLGSLDGLSLEEALSNLALDARLYQWNPATQAAIKEGILVRLSR